MAEGKNVIDLSVLKRILSFTKSYRVWLYSSVLFIVLLAASGPLRPMLVKMIVNDALPAEDTKLMMTYAGIILGLLLFEGFLQFAYSYSANWLGQSIIRDIRVQLFRKVSNFNLKYFDQTPIGSLVTRMISDVEAISEVFSQSLLTIIGELLKIITVVGFMLWENWRFALLVLIPIPLLLWITRIFANAMKKAFQHERLQVNRLGTFVQEHVIGMNIVQIFNRQEVEYSKFREINKEHLKAHINAVWAFSIFFPTVELLSSLSTAILIVWAVLQATWAYELAEITIGQMFAFILWINMLYRPIRQLADRFNTLQRGVVRAERVFQVIDEEETATIESNGTEKKFSGEVSFDKIWFAYKEEQWVLKDISFSAERGQSVAIVGATGSGKTSLISLLLRFYEYQKGDILMDGKSLQSYDLDELRTGIGLVLQDVFLFSDSILNNITLKNPNIDFEQVQKASKIIGAHDFIENLPGGYSFNVGERGGVLSAGQRQIIAFIRVYVHNPKLLILDEATSSVDTLSEEMIQYATKQITQERTSIIIAHRLSTIKNADKILVLDKGQIVEQGSHNELLEKDGAYKKLYDFQYSQDPI